MCRIRIRSALLILVLAAGVGHAEEATAPGPSVDVPLGGSRHLRLGSAITRLSVASKDIADVAAFPPDDLLITGKALGQTHVMVWNKNGEAIAVSIRVNIATDSLKDRLRALFPEHNVSVGAIGGAITLSGEVPDANLVVEIEKVAAAQAALLGQQGRVINLIRVLGTPQVQLEVRFAEVSRTALRQIGVNVWSRTGDTTRDVATGLLNPSTALGGVAPEAAASGGLSTLQLPNGLSTLSNPISSTFSLLIATSPFGKVPITATLSLLASRGFAKTLAEPTLVALSGQEGTFLAGGEFPIPIPQAFGTATIQFKKFGIQLKFLPVVLGDQTVQLKMETQVSDVDPSLGIRSGGIAVPGLTQRESTTTVRLRDGQSFAIAGLLSDRMRSTVDKLPILGDIPVLGALFRSSSFRHDETELMVVVTARLVNPMAKGTHIQLPGEDEVSDPNDFMFYLMGASESHTPAPAGKAGFMR